MKILKTMIAAGLVLSTGAALAAPSPGVKCRAGKNKIAGAYYACREKAEAAAVSKGGSADYSKCIPKFTDKWNDVKLTSDVTCPDVALADVDAYIRTQAANAARALTGTGTPKCGDGAVNKTGEHCDGTDLDGYSCGTFGFFGTLACTAGCDFNLSGCTTSAAPAVEPAAPAPAAATSVADKCRASKNKAVGAYYACREKAEATAISKSVGPDYSKCTTKFIDKWGAAELAASTMCEDNMAVGDMEPYVSGQATEVTEIVAGSRTIPKCGDGAINAPGEQCDGSDLDGYTCTSFNMHGTLACTPDCNFDPSLCTTCPAPGIKYAGACWALGDLSANCNSACAGLGLVYSDATRTIAGSAGTNENCVALLDAFGTPGDALDNAGDTCGAGHGLGCAVVTDVGFRARCGTPATDATSIQSGAQRVCACQ